MDSMDNNDWVDFPFNRRWVFYFSILTILMGLGAPLFLVVGFLTLIMGVFLFFTDSWIFYLLIFCVWTFGGFWALLNSISGILPIFIGIIVVLVGAMNLYFLAETRKKKVSGHL